MRVPAWATGRGKTGKTKFGVEMKEPPQPTAGTTSVGALVCVPQALTKGGVTYKDEVWHKECFLCTGCSAPLAGQPFTSQGESPYCIRCFSSLYAKKCVGCNTAITGQSRPTGGVKGEEKRTSKATSQAL